MSLRCGILPSVGEQVNRHGELGRGLLTMAIHRTYTTHVHLLYPSKTEPRWKAVVPDVISSLVLENFECAEALLAFVSACGEQE